MLSNNDIILQLFIYFIDKNNERTEETDKRMVFDFGSQNIFVLNNNNNKIE